MFNIKQGHGGIVDIEFIVQFIVLARASDFACLANWTDNIRQLETLAATNIVTQPEADKLIAAYKDYRAAAHLAALKQQGAELSVKLFSENMKNVEQVWLKVFSAGPEE